MAPSSLAIAPNSASASADPATITWPGAFEIRDPGFTIDTTAGRLDSLVVEAENGDHRPRGGFGRLLHGRTAFGDEAETVFKIERT